MKLKVSYFAILKDERGLAQEELDTAAATPVELYASLKNAHKFSLNQDSLRVAINEEFVNWTVKLNEGDQVVFIPPVAGG
jgi:molybdopterin converting factor subunit 1